MTWKRRSEREMVQELNEGREAWLARPDPKLTKLRELLNSDTSNFYVINWIPEQGEDLYWFLVDGKIVAHVEFTRATGALVEGTFKIWTVDSYVREHSLSKTRRRRLELAVSLATISQVR